MAITQFRTKADFVRSMSDSSPKAISAAAAELGMKLSRAYVKRIRYLDRTALRRTKPEVESQRIKHVLSMPPTTPAKEVVEAAAAQGIKMTERYVYAIRARKSGPPSGKAKPSRPPQPTKVAAAVRVGRRLNLARGAKTAFVTRMPPDMPVKEVIKAAGFRGIVLTEAYVHRIRAIMRLRGGPPIRRPIGVSEQQLRRAISEIGLARAREILAEVEARFGR